MSIAKSGPFEFAQSGPNRNNSSIPSESRVSLPVSSADVLAERYSAGAALSDEIQHGNGDLMRALKALGMAGPFKRVSPWVLTDETGREKINVGGYAATPFGDRYPPLTDFIRDYLERDRTMDLPNQSAAAWRAALETNLVALLATFAPSHADSRVFFSNSGAEAVETAIKFVKAARPRAREIINFKGAYHGKTLGALALTPNAEYQDAFKPLMPNVTTLPYGDLAALESAVRRLGARNIAAVIVEPTQGEAGVISPPPGFLRGLGALCERHGILVIADEIQTGLGRTGHWFASLADDLEPDIITLAKPLGGGMTAVGATIARRAVYAKTLAGFTSKRHSNTFGGNSLAMAIGVKSLEMLVAENLPERSKLLGEQGLERLQALQQKYPNLLEAVRGTGLLMALQFRPVLPQRIVPGLSELIGELSGLLGLRTVFEGGVIANASLSSKRVVRLTPALNIPEALYAQVFERIGGACERNPTANHMLRQMPVDRLYHLGRLGLSR